MHRAKTLGAPLHPDKNEDTDTLGVDGTAGHSRDVHSIEVNKVNLPAAI